MDMPTKQTAPFLLKPDKKVAAGLAVLFIFSRLLFYVSGLRFSATDFIGGCWQLADTNLLSHKLAQTVWYLYGQPPLYNLLIGVAIKTFPVHYPAVLHGFWSLAGLLIVLALYILLRLLAVPKWPAGLIAVFWMLSPAAILYENWVFYEYPLAALLCLAALALPEFMAGKMRYGLFFFSVLAVCAATRSLFHPLWFMGTIGLMLIIMKNKRFFILKAAALPLLFVLAWPVKNLILFGSPADWSGMNRYKIISRFLPESERIALVKASNLPPACIIYPFSRSSNDYTAAGVTLPDNPYPDVPLMADTVKHGGEVNFHNYRFREIARQNEEGARNLMRLRPMLYLKSIAAAALLFFEPPSRYPFLETNRLHLGRYDSLYYPLLIALPSTRHPHYLDPLALLLFAVTACYIILRLVIIIAAAANGRAAGKKEGLFWFLVYCCGYISAAGIGGEIGENMRFRFQMLPFGYVLAGYSFYRIYLPGLKARMSH